MTSTAIVNNLWNFCHTLRDDGVGHGREQQVGLPLKQFIPMVHIVTKRTPKSKASAIVKGAIKRSRKKKGADFSDLVGTAPLHGDPVKFQRALRDEE
jgi:hypothetical protein